MRNGNHNNKRKDVSKIGQYGYRIKNIEGSTLLEYNNGVRKNYEYKDAMLTNSLLLDFLCENGLKVHKEESTRDIICLEFNFGTRSYEEEITHLNNMAIQYRLEYKLAKSKGNKNDILKKKNKRRKIAKLFVEAQRKKDSYKKLTKEEVREFFYVNGVDVEYISKSKDGTIKKKETIHYKMLFRSTGKAKKGSCMFIRDKLHKKTQKFIYMGIKLPKENAPLVEVSAYAPLIASTIIGKIKINPKNILILKDVDRFFNTNVISVETNSKKECEAKYIDNYKLKNTLFDGQALIDSSIFPSWGNGYVLLRHHFCKMACFNTNIQKFFKDYFGDNYQTAKVKDMFGVEHYVKDIEVITTDNAMKWLKLDKSYDYWCERVYENGCMFGVVKTSHESKLGKVQRMSYQMINCLDEKIMGNVVEESISYINKLKTDDDFFLDYLKKNSNFSNDYEVLVALCEQNKDFIRSEYFRERKKFIIKSYVLNFKSGKVIQNADNLVVVGSPYAMLLYGATGDEDSVDYDDTFEVEKGTIQCYTERFNHNEYLAFFRSPFNSKNNLLYLHNKHSEKMKRYFNFGRQIVAINMNGTDAQDRANGMDMDSDSGYTTNQVDIVEFARQCYIEHPTIVNNIPKEKNNYSSSLSDYALMDNTLASCQLDIGESSNLAQICQTYSCNFSDKKFIDYVCILSVLAQVSIDSAKRRFDVDVSSEIKRIKNDMGVKNIGLPIFWKLIRQDTSMDRINKNLRCPMNYLYDLELDKFRNNSPTLPMKHFFEKFELEKNRKSCKKVEELIQKYSLEVFDYNITEENSCKDSEYLLLRSDFEDLIKDIQTIYISKNYIGLMSWLIDRAFSISNQIGKNSNTIKSTIKTNKSILLKVLYSINKQNLLRCFSKNA